jgi:hypothetical protein
MLNKFRRKIFSGEQIQITIPALRGSGYNINTHLDLIHSGQISNKEPV